MNITFTEKEEKKEIKFPANLEHKSTGNIVLAFDKNSGIIVKKGDRSGLNAGYFSTEWDFKYNYWEVVSGETTFKTE